MNVSDQILKTGLKHVLSTQHKDTCVMFDADGKEVPVTKAMVVSVCHQLLKQCRNIKN